MVNKSGRISTRRKRTRGRPKAEQQENVREALLLAARELFARYGYRAVSSRQVAAAAGANVAMIRYYFGGKPGLYKEILERLIAPARAQVDVMAAHPGQGDIGSVLGLASRIWAANPWMAGIVVREVLAPEGTLRPIFTRDVIARIVPLVERVVQEHIDRGAWRADLDSRLTVLSMVSLAIFPYLAYTLTSRVFGVRQDEEFVMRLIEHNRRLLAHGVQTRPEKAE